MASTSVPDAQSSRSINRVLHIWTADHDTNYSYIGGLQHIGTTNSTDLLLMIHILLPNASPDMTVQGPSGLTLSDDSSPLEPGDYVVSGSHFEVTQEPVLTRALSLTSGMRVRSFRAAVRERDGRCVVTKFVNTAAKMDEWTRFQAAHIFPLAYEQQWVDGNYGSYITLVPATGGSINSVQNGLLLRTDLHDGFDQYLFTINPRANHKVVVFREPYVDLDGLALDRQLLDDPRRPPDELLWWHFTQAVLANMRGSGEPIFEEDFPPGSDMMGEIQEGPHAVQRLTFELSSRLANHMDIVEDDIEKPP
ncbi:hypothetical protein SBRCBS47491_000946 [Sporothrix bragantina]|uniref:HNH nuclease domain-containing protein n=1 Tax=Sporothrix bragantina TaxID=671064 RepID=A0ABP0AUL5_9PEZI